MGDKKTQGEIIKRAFQSVRTREAKPLEPGMSISAEAYYQILALCNIGDQLEKIADRLDRNAMNSAFNP